MRDFAEQRVAPVAEELDREARFPYELVAEMAELGLMGMPIPRGVRRRRRATPSRTRSPIEELTRVDSSVAITVAAHHSLGTMPIYSSADERAEGAVAAATSRPGRGLAAFGLTEPERRLRRRRDAHDAPELRDGEWIVNGSKIFITNAGTDITVVRHDHRAAPATTRSRTSSSRTARPATRSRRR